ncbi:glutamyl-Q tRNA(Asp) synthetase [Bifidobacterium oedipodis]|uniref:Glutamyl-Q tRNA(Asp) ligase n=1 Tax=Bifidobacterium oedipodis TaxID=2675322 RepID=A0A7Y0HTG2_9BIFI|nr:glutamyl-Q tRNA(Asp) synthetase [Bifidobacterium sp. DSM 109957]NMM95071.1 glutamyl-Q tRNA(Asp) ligase [Bifidobacterium sp. DSM 109957]
MTGRFAPTPSGRMHIGNIYAMLGAWLSARAQGQRMLLRIEDIDTPRVLPDADRLMMDDLVWLGLDWDGEPVYQSSPDRQARYVEALDCLGRAGVLYPCFCSRADLRAASAPNEGDGFMVYPGTCRRLINEHPDEVQARLDRGDRHSLRIVMPGEWAEPPKVAADAFVGFADKVFGPQLFNLPRMVGDSVIRRADGLFAYQLVVVVDDLDMGVDDIVRGRDLLRSTALQMWIRRCLLDAGFVPECARQSSQDGSSGQNRETPRETLRGTSCETSQESSSGSNNPTHPSYAHLPLIDNAAGRRLAKRERSLDMGALRARGVRTEQIIGYCAWLLRLQPTPDPCQATDLLDSFSWAALRASHADRALDPSDPLTPQWLVESL